MFEYQAPTTLLANKNILVTGAGSGLGRAAALSYAKHGATVILSGRNVENLEKTYDDIEASGGAQPAIVPLDLETATDQQYLAFSNSIENELGPLHGLLHSAGMLGSMTPAQSYSVETWNNVMQVNLNGCFALTKHMLPLLQLADTASIIFTSSTVGRQARAYWGAYCVSKAAVEAFMQVLFQELEKTSKIRVNSINPGACRTAMRKQAFPGEDPATLRKPEELMALYLYLMGEESLSKNGQQFDAQTKK